MAVAIRRAAAARSGGVTATAAMTASRRRRRLSTALVRPTPPRQLYFLKQEANPPTGVARAQWMSQVNTSLEASDPEIFEIVEREKTRQVRACGDPTPPHPLASPGRARPQAHACAQMTGLQLIPSEVSISLRCATPHCAPPAAAPEAFAGCRRISPPARCWTRWAR